MRHPVFFVRTAAEALGVSDANMRRRGGAQV
jgi:hypothetical protein